MTKNILGSDYNIIQAPMAGVVTPALVAEVSDAGAYGMLAAGDADAGVLDDWIDEVRELTRRDFGVNFFVPGEFEVDESEEERVVRLLEPLYQEAGVTFEDEPLVTYSDIAKNFYRQIDTCLEKGIQVYSFIFGIPPADVSRRIKEAGGIIIATATTSDEAQALSAEGADIIVAQGREAGGHRGSFMDNVENSLIGTYTLVKDIKESGIDVPVVATGGIMNGSDAVNMMAIADAVQLGTAFITTVESKAAGLHKEELLKGNAGTRLSRAFTGRHARAIDVELMHEIEQSDAIIAYPAQRALAKGLIAHGKEARDRDYAMMLAGAGYAGACRDMGAGELVETLVTEVRELGGEGVI